MMLRLVPASLLVAGFVGSTVLAHPTSLLEGPDSGARSNPARTSGGAKATSSSTVNGAKLVTSKGTATPTIDVSPAARTPRHAYPKKATDSLALPINKRTGELSFTGRILVKLRDDLGARAPKAAPAPHIMSIGGADLGAFDAVLAQFGGSAQASITGHSDEALRALELKAEAHSGKPQPDLASMMTVTVQPGMELQAARALNDLDIVEFVDFERPLELHQIVGCVANNPLSCNVPGPNCDPDGFNCNPDPGCLGLPTPTCEAGCKDVVCCELVSSIRTSCPDSDQQAGWDIFCAAYANLLCDGTIYDGAGPLPPADRYDPCFSDGAGAANPIFALVVPLLSGSCFEVRDQHGCNIAPCCFSVCSLDPVCCTVGWDAGCVQMALSDTFANICGPGVDPGATPNYTSETVANPNFPGIGEPVLLTDNFQTYIKGEPVLGDFSALPPAFTGQFVFLNSGFRGGGFDLPALRLLQQQFSELYQDGLTPILDGKGTNLGIVEFSAFVNHEEFTTNTDGTPLAQPKVIPEPNQTIILIEGGANQPQHGTATLGECVAAKNGRGVTGIAFRAQGYFFPTLSVEEGSRLNNAITSAGITFHEGDVLNYSIGFGGAGPIIIDPTVAALIAVLSDVGITSCMSAGNDSIPIVAAPFETGAMVVGACWPGMNLGIDPCTNSFWRYCRLGFSNFSDPEDADGLAQVHLCAWGTAIATTGYGDLFTGANGTDPADPETNQLRKYTSVFNGTSGAAPMITGLAAVLQGWARQAYGAPISPLQLRGIMAGNGRTPDQCNPLGTVFGPDRPECNPQLGDDITPLIGTFPDALECGYSIMNGQFIGANGTEVKIVYGTAPATSPPSSFRIRAVDGNYLKIITKWADAGQKVEGLSYLATGHTTDVIAFLETPADEATLTSVALNVTSKATKPFVILGGFLYNWQDQRYDFTGVTFIGPAPVTSAFPVQQMYLSKYIGPGDLFEARVWTCGLGNTGPHQVWHDFISIQVIGSTQTP